MAFPRISDMFWKLCQKSPPYENMILTGSVLGGISGAVYPIVTAECRKPFFECVSMSVVCCGSGAIVGTLVGTTWPVWALGAGFGGPLWLSQRLRFPEK